MVTRARSRGCAQGLPTGAEQVTQTPVKKDTQVIFPSASGGGRAIRETDQGRRVRRRVGYVSAERVLQDYGVVVSAQGKLEGHAIAERRKARPQ